MPADSALLANTSLSPQERAALLRATQLLEAELGDDLHAVWLYGSRARGERGEEESDVDLLVVTREGLRDLRRVGALVDAAAESEGLPPLLFSLQLYTPEQLEQRREIRSFFIREVDRDKIVLVGDR